MYLQRDQIIAHRENDIVREFSRSRVLPNDHSIHVERIENQSRFARRKILDGERGEERKGPLLPGNQSETCPM